MSILKYQLFIGGGWVDAVSGKTFKSYNPATGEVLAEVAEAGPADIDRAVAAARRAFDQGPWHGMIASERGRIIYRIGELLRERAEELARLETMDNGRPIGEIRAVDVPRAIDCFEYYAGLATKIMGETIPLPGNFLDFTLREPIGVVGQIIPWNFPLLMAAWKVAPALAAGCTVILKPSRQTSCTALELARIGQEAGLPDGVLNVCPGPGQTAGVALASHPDVDKVAFTGETATGREIMRMASGNIKDISLELGGKSPNIVFDDADFDLALARTLRGIFFAQGHNCSAGSRLLLQEGVYDLFLERLVERAQAIQVGDPLKDDTQMGAINSKEQLEKVERYVQIGLDEGARLLCGGKRPDDPWLSKGCFYLPTIFADVDNRMRIAQEEIFGPVLAVIRFKDDDEAIRIANDVIYGLAAAVWTRDINRAIYMAKRIRAGYIWVNAYGGVYNEAPFGGYKQSGIGRELGVHAMELYTQVKNVSVYLGG